MKENNLHVIVASSGCEQDKLKYRHHRVCEFLRQREETKNIYWIIPVLTAFRKSHRLTFALPFTKTNEQAIKELSLSD